MITNYKDLIVWQRSMDLVEAPYRITAGLPHSEQFGLVAQMRRRCVCSLKHCGGIPPQATREYRHYLLISRGSLLELETQLLLCQKLKYVDPKQAMRR